MPTYAYACTTCEHRFEVQQSFTDAALTECPECRGRLRKMFNSVGIVFKGSGFYRTDSRSSTKTESSSSSESTPAAKAESTSSTDSSKKSTASTPATTGSAA